MRKLILIDEAALSGFSDFKAVIRGVCDD